MSNAHITIYTRPLCIWCFRAKRLLRKHGYQFEERDARQEETRAMLLERTGHRTVPQIFFGGRSVGGFEALRALADAGALSSIVQST
jgi:glutaredoxin 3